MVDESETATRRGVKRTTYVDAQTWTRFSEFKAGIIGRKGESAVARALAELGVEALNDVLLGDLLGVTQIDHLVRAADAIVVIETKTYGGHITGSLESPEWVQHLAAGETLTAFQNPVHQNRRHCRAVEEAVCGLNVPIAGFVVSAGAATFCTELQSVVVPLAGLSHLLRRNPRRDHDPSHLTTAWHRMLSATAAAESRREEHQETLRQRRKGPGVTTLEISADPAA